MNNFSSYGTLVKDAAPLLLMAFATNVTELTPRWGTLALACLTANETSPGSRVLTSSAEPNHMLGMGIVGWGVLGVFALLELL